MSTDPALEPQLIPFREIQRFRQPWLWILLSISSLAVILTFGYGMIRQLYFGMPWGNRPLSDAALAILGPLFILVSLLPLGLLSITRMVTEVRPDRLHVHFRPFFRRDIPFGEITRSEVRSYRPIREYGGWGIRGSFAGGGKAYTIGGNQALQLELTGGRRLLIGSGRPEALQQALEAGRGARR